MIQVYHFTFAGFAQKALRMRGDRFTTGRVEGFFDRLAGVGKTVAAVSESVAREVSTFYGHTASVLPNGVDVIRFRRHSPDDAREQLDLPRDARIGLFVGRAEYAKGFDFVLEIARKMPDVNIVSVSQPIPGPSGLLFRADIPHERMALLYSAADFFLLPSRYEGFNLSLLEALACELPAVTSSAAYPFGEESPDLATVVDPLTSEGLVKAIRQTMDRGPQRNLRERIVREYSLDAFSDRWTRLVRSVLAGG